MTRWPHLRTNRCESPWRTCWPTTLISRATRSPWFPWTALNGSATLADGVITFTPANDYVGTAAKFTYEVSDGNGTKEGTVNITVEATNDAALIANLDGTVNFTEGGNAVGLGTMATLTDDATFYKAATLTVSSSSGDVKDRVFVPTSAQGSPVTATAFGSGHIKFNSTVIGNFTGGFGNGTSLVITFNSNATKAMVEAVIRRVRFSNTSQNPVAGDRTISYQLKEMPGNVLSNLATKVVHVIAQNDAPTLTPASVVFPDTYVNNTTPGAVFGQLLTAGDVERNFNGGKLELNVTEGAHDSNRLSIVKQDGLTIVGDELKRNGITVAIISEAKYGSPGSPPYIGVNKLTLTFNANATMSTVQLVVTHLAFRTAGGASIADRVIKVELFDSEGASAISTTTIHVRN